MFKIPSWEDDVPKSKVDFGKSNKPLNKKEKKANHPKKSIIENKSLPLKGAKKQSEKFQKHNKGVKSNNQSQDNGYGKGIQRETSKTFIKKGGNFKRPALDTNTRPGNYNTLDFENKFNNNSAENVANNKKKRPKKRKLNDQDTTAVKKQTVSQNGKTLSHDSAPSKAKKKKLNDEEMAKEGSILLSVAKKKKKGHQILKSENVKVLGNKLEQKKEKFRQMLQQETSRSKINVSGDNLRQRMLERLKSAQFRFLNEKLYTTSGSEAQKLFQSDPEAFHTYHEGYQQQVKKWPVNPLDLIVKRISKMPKTHLIADMGCGEAALSRRVQQKVRSFDLVASAAGVEACDMAHTPLLTGAADAAVYCLALMGTDLTQYLVEANRVLKPGGHLLIAEVESRFDKVENFVEDVQRLGFKLKNLDKSHQVFYFLEFVKIRDPPAKKGKLPAISLKPCLYKRR